MTKYTVQLKNVTKKIKGKIIIDNLSFSVQRGEIFGLLGPNGAGKTTSIRMMVGLISVTDGEIFINNDSITHNFKKAISHVGAVVENPELYKFLTGYQNLWHYANMFPGITEERIEEVVTIVGLKERIDDKVKTYSLGMRQRLGVAQALLHHPSVLILDEPTNGLDPAGIRELRQYLRNLVQKEDVSVIVSSHLLSEMELMCDRIAIIQKGKLVELQTIQRQLKQEDSAPYLFEVDNPLLAREQLTENYPRLMVNIVGNSLEVVANRQRVARITTCLVNAGVEVYGIRLKTKSLEDKFMEVTGGVDIV